LKLTKQQTTCHDRSTPTKSANRPAGSRACPGDTGGAKIDCHHVKSRFSAAIDRAAI
jgi:hypothetical protein